MVNPKRAVYKTLGLVRLHLSSLHSCSPEKGKTWVTVRQFILTQPTVPIHFHSAHSANSFSLSPQCQSILLSPQYRIILLSPQCHFIFTQPTVRIHFHSAHSANSFSLSPQYQFIFTQPTVPIHFHSAHSANPCSLSPQCQSILTKPTGPIHFHSAQSDQLATFVHSKVIFLFCNQNCLDGCYCLHPAKILHHFQPWLRLSFQLDILNILI